MLHGVPQPTQSYHPRATLRLIVRLDEFGADSRLQKLAPTATTKNLNGVLVNRSPLQAQLDSSAPAGVTRYVLALPGQVAATGGPQDQTQSQDQYTFDVTVIPKTASWQQNGVQQANTLHAAIKYIDCPLDPRLIRACGVELYLGCVTEDQAAEANSGESPPGAPVLPTSFVGPRGESRTNLRFQGFVTTWEVDWGESEPVISLECQDNSTLLHNQEMPPRLVLSMTDPLDKAVADFLANFVQLAGLTVEYLPSTDTPPTLGPVLSGTAYRPNLGPPASKGGGAAQSKQSAWDYLTDVCGSVAHTIRMDGTTLIIQRARALLTSTVTPRADDPYKPRTIDNATYPFRTLLYGRNVKTLKVRRSYGKKAVANTECRSYSTERKTVLVGRFPAQQSVTNPGESDRQVYALPGNTTPDQKWAVYNVPGIKDQATLQKIAQGIYEQVGRQELGVEIKTQNLGSFGGSNLDPDVLDMKVGDTFELLVNRDTAAVNDLTRIETALTAQAQNAALMLSLGFSQAFADAYAQAYVNAGFTTTYRLKTMKVDWSADDGGGVTMEINGTNYIEVRADKFLPPGQEPSNSVQAQPQPAVPPTGAP